ncbi:hypothetical protein GZH53_03090 [Flavihumibacter sp. R14]|nr:hypothetical protein [Flavihumibacter soli]
MKNTDYFRIVLAFAAALFTIQSCKEDGVSGIEPLSNNPDNQVSDELYQVSTIAGNKEAGFVDGKGSNALFSDVRGITVSADGKLFVADGGNSAIREINPLDSQVTTLAGNGTFGFSNGTGRNATFNLPTDVSIAPDGYIYSTDFFNYKIRKISRAGEVTTFAGADSGYVDGPLSKARFGKIYSIEVCKDGIIYVFDDYKVRRITPKGIVSTIAGSTFGYADGPAKDAKFSSVVDITVGKDGAIYLADLENNAIRKISGGVVSTVVKSPFGYLDGPLNTARFSLIQGIVFDEDGSLYVADSRNNRIRKISVDNVVSTIAGTSSFIDDQYADGPGISAKFFNPISLIIYKNALYVADNGNNRIRKINLE